MLNTITQSKEVKMENTKSYQHKTRLFLKNFNLHEATKLFNAVLYEKKS